MKAKTKFTRLWSILIALAIKYTVINSHRKTAENDFNHIGGFLLFFLVYCSSSHLLVVYGYFVFITDFLFWQYELMIFVVLKEK